MLDKIYYGNSLESWSYSFLIIVGAVLLTKIIVFANKNIIRKLTRKTSNRLDDILFKMLEAPVLLGIMLVAIWFAANRLNLNIDIKNIISKSYSILIVVNITWFVARFINALIEEYLIPAAEVNNHKYLDNTLIPIIRRTALGVIWSLGIVMALNNVGVDVATLIAGLGIGGLAFALAAQDTIKNVFGGVTIFTDRPFRIGDRIKVDGFDGFVEDIGIRSTRLRTLEKRLVTIPNYKIVEASVENVSDEPMRRVLMNINLTYSTTPEKMEEAIQILKNMPNVIKNLDNNEIVVTFDEFADSALVIKFIYYVNKIGDVMETPSEVNFEILRSFTKAGLKFAYPTKTIYFESESEIIKK
ncbi:MAG TPA: mechanosensitive ion channel family protein [Paludibacter sp.]|nr:mechanosensitive ion channel family protein [Paludibacter sp.]